MVRLSQCWLRHGLLYMGSYLKRYVMLVGLILNEYLDCEVFLVLGCWDFFVAIIDGKGTITLRPDSTWAEVRRHVEVY